MQAEAQKRYKVINTTIKAARLNEQGRDTRTASERVGHAVGIRLDNGKTVMVTPTRPAMLPFINESILRRAREGMLEIQQISGIEDALKEHTLSVKKPAPRAAEQETAETVLSNMEKAPTVHAQQMGFDVPPYGASKEYDGATNPDGEPNFVVKAPTKKPAADGSKKKGLNVNG